MGTRYKEMLLKLVLTVILFTSVFAAARKAAVVVNEGKAGQPPEEKRFCVVVDAGHGGDDPGKIGINGALEKELNLRMAEKLAAFLRASDVEVVMTRTADGGLYDENTSNKKVQDMRRRIRIIEEARPQLVVSIHQNSYGEETVDGAQVFYYEGSARGKQLAELIQFRLVENLDPDNHRAAKANDKYYLLKKTSKPIVIVECGFLSNRAEAEKLCDSLYQERVAWQIHMGILQYLNQNAEGKGGLG